MYEALAIAIEMNHGAPDDIKIALNYAADLALKTHNPNFLVSVADAMYMKGFYDRIGPLLDEAAEKVPHRSIPLSMSINLAQKTKDPRRMGESIDRLLSLGWPGEDEYFRTESRNQAETLAKVLREDGRGAEADALLAKVTNSEARDVFIRLTWDGQADFDVTVEEPLGATASYLIPRTVFGGSMLKNGYGAHPEEVYSCPRGFDGDYTVRINTIWVDPSKPVTRLTLETIAHEGTAKEQKTISNLVPDKLNKPFVVHLSEGRRRKTVLPYIDILAGRIVDRRLRAQLKKSSKTRKSAKSTRRSTGQRRSQTAAIVEGWRPGEAEVLRVRFASHDAATRAHASHHHLPARPAERPFCSRYLDQTRSGVARLTCRPPRFECYQAGSGPRRDPATDGVIDSEGRSGSAVRDRLPGEGPTSPSPRRHRRPSAQPPPDPEPPRPAKQRPVRRSRRFIHGGYSTACVFHVRGFLTRMVTPHETPHSRRR